MPIYVPGLARANVELLNTVIKEHRPPHKSRPEPRALGAPSLGTNPWRPMPPRRPRLIKGLPAPRALSSPTRIITKILWETVIYSAAISPLKL
eukprot:COSAG04_NODE_367_length_15823_cov_6.139977_10_plen_93_part_00